MPAGLSAVNIIHEVIFVAEIIVIDVDVVQSLGQLLLR